MSATHTSIERHDVVAPDALRPAGEASTPETSRPSDPLPRPPVTKFGAIDVGTNSIHLVMAEITPEGDFRVVGQDKEMVQIGRGGFAQHILTPGAIETAMAVLRRFAKLAQLREVTQLRAVATSAVREARNGGDFVARVHDELGIDLHVISAEEEARLIYLGVRHAVDLGPSASLIVDIGGGSVEVIVGNTERAEILASLKLGGARLSELFLRSDPPAADELKAMRRHIEQQLEPLFARIGPRRFARCIATSGTVGNLATICTLRRGAAEIEPVTQLTIRRDELKALVSDLAGMTRAQRLSVPGLDSRRVDVILPAAMLLLSVMRAFDVDQVQHCDSALREGIIIDHIARHRDRLLARATWPDPRMRSVIQLAERCGYRRDHAEQVARLALQLYDQLEPLHRLDPQYRELLRVGCLLHDIGYLISHDNHHKHSYYLVRNGGLQGFSQDEIEIIANLVRYHRKGRPRKSHYSWQHLPRAHRRPVRRLIALLRLANALDRTHYSVVRSVSAMHADGDITVYVHTDQDAELELWTARRQKAYFERAWKCRLSIVPTGAPQG